MPWTTVSFSPLQKIIEYESHFAWAYLSVCLLYLKANQHALHYMQEEIEMHVRYVQEAPQLCGNDFWIVSALSYLSDLFFFWGGEISYEGRVMHKLIFGFWCKPECLSQTPMTSSEAESVSPIPVRYRTWAGTNIRKAVRHLPANDLSLRTKTFLWGDIPQVKSPQVPFIFTVAAGSLSRCTPQADSCYTKYRYVREKSYCH